MRGRHLISLLAACVAGSLIVACSSAPAARPPRSRRGPSTRSRRSDTYGNYGEQFTTFCQVNFGFDCNREDRDIGEEHELGRGDPAWDAEKNNPQSIVADIGILFIPQAEEVGILADYEPPNASLLPDDLHGPGWVSTFIGVPTFLVNVDVLEDRGLPVPETWADLTNPAYEGLVGLGRVGVSGSGTWAFVAMNLAAGGTSTNWQPGIEYGKRLLPNIDEQASLETFERGEVPIAIRFDFNKAPWFDELDERRRQLQARRPQRRLGLRPVDADDEPLRHRPCRTSAKMFMEWVLTDEAQVIFAKFGARPIRSVVGDDPLVVPDEARAELAARRGSTRSRRDDRLALDRPRRAIRRSGRTQVVGGRLTATGCGRWRPMTAAPARRDRPLAQRSRSVAAWAPAVPLLAVLVLFLVAPIVNAAGTLVHHRRRHRPRRLDSGS